MGVQTGRPTVITPTNVRKLEQAFRDGLNISQACYTSGISTSTYYDHLASDKAFSDKMGLAQEYVTIKAKQLVAQEINDGNLGAAKWWLERKAKAEFGTKDTLNELPLQTNDGGDDLKQIVTELRRVGSLAEQEAAIIPAVEPIVEYAGSGVPLL